MAVLMVPEQHGTLGFALHSESMLERSEPFGLASVNVVL